MATDALDDTLLSTFASEATVYTVSELLDLTSRIYRSDGQARKRVTLLGDARAHNLQILHGHYDPGGDTGPTMLELEAHEGGIVVAGELEITVGNEVRVLKAGDAYLFDSRRLHRIRNIGDRPAEVMPAYSPPYL